MPRLCAALLALSLAACPAPAPVDECPNLDDLAICADVIAEVYAPYTEIDLCCDGAANTRPTGAVCDAMIGHGGFDPCVIETCYAENPCAPLSPICADYYDYLHHSVVGCNPPAPCRDSGALYYCEDPQFECVNGLCVIID